MGAELAVVVTVAAIFLVPAALGREDSDTSFWPRGEMGNALDGGLKSKDNDKQYEALHDAIATVLAAAFTMWLPMQQVMLVMGKGPIPTFAPPYVPVGPVVAGDIISTPGHLMS